MNQEEIKKIAYENTEKQRKADYSGRTIIMGITPDEKHYVQVYWTVGRSKSSQNRKMLRDGENIKTEPIVIDPSMVRPELLIYNVARVFENKHIISNGSQTDNIYDALKVGKRFEDAIDEINFEHDGPIFTPRISGVIELLSDGVRYRLSVNKSTDHNPEFEVRAVYSYNKIFPGTGYCIHTYDTEVTCDSFSGEPFLMTIFDDINETSDFYWNLIPKDKRVAMYVKYINVESGKVFERILNDKETIEL